MFDLNTKVLVVDDMLTMRKLVTKSCKEIGFEDIVDAPDGNKAWDVLQSADFGLVLSDWNMPEVSGLDLLKKVRADDRFKTLPFLLITAESEKSQIMEAIGAGVTNYIVKPFTTDTLKEKLEAAHKKVTG